MLEYEVSILLIIMESVSPPSSSRARIVVLISHLRLEAAPSRLALEVQRAVPAYAAQAEIEVADKVFAEALDYARGLERAHKVDAFVCAGATGAFLRKHLAMPVLLMHVGGFDMLRALEQARRVTDKVAVLSYRQVSRDLEEVKPLFAVDVRQGCYTTLEEAKACVHELAAQGCRAIIGSSMVTELAEEAGITGIAVLSKSAARQALDDALAIYRSSRAEAMKRQRLNAILHHLTEGVVAVGMDGKVQSINPAMARLLDVSIDEAIGRPVDDWVPQFALTDVLRAGVAEENRILKIGNRAVVANLLPIFEDGVQTGAVLTCQDTGAVQRADRRIRSSTRPTSFVAKYRLPQIVGDSPAIRDVISLAEQYAKTDSTVLITGESGTGKELLAQGIHNASRRRGAPFVAINCAAFPETLLESELFGYEEGAFTGSRKGGKPGLLESAHTGTVFFDEIGDMSLPLQTRLLRVLQEREVLHLGSTEPTPIDVRVIAATHRDLRKNIAEGRFREDLFYRLNILRLHLPPLRERKADIPAIARWIIRGLGKRPEALSPADRLLQGLLPYLESYPWPGNIRELENITERAVLSLVEEDLSRGDSMQRLRSVIPEFFEARSPAFSAQNPMSLRALTAATELDFIRNVLDECGGEMGEAAKRLGVSRSTLWRRLHQRRPQPT
jgi:propionate catabolism operon transcriptional regulator